MFSGLDHACARSRFGGFGWVFAMRRRGTAVPPTDSFILFRSWSLCRLYSLPLSSMGLNSMVCVWGRIVHCFAHRKFFYLVAQYAQYASRLYGGCCCCCIASV